jgi:hypothetical protein
MLPDDSLIHACISLWAADLLGSKSDDDWPFLHNEFVARYRDMRCETPQYPPVLIGIAGTQSEGKSETGSADATR